MTKRLSLLIIGFAILSLVVFVVKLKLTSPPDGVFTKQEGHVWWEVQSIDTVKYSRDLARQMGSDASFDAIIEEHISSIASTGATHVALGTPYDEEFVPFLARWVSVARKYDLNVWFRGNFSGWENWFNYERINREEHIQLAQKFILDNGRLFEDGDIFSACTECENGGPGDPRANGDVEGHREFLIEEYKVTNDAFRKIGKNVRSNFFPMNGDVANLVMDKNTTKDLGGIVVIDHYIRSPEQLSKDIKALAEKSGGRVVLGEFGVPISDIHGQMTEKEQADWIEDALEQLSKLPELVGVNYWVSRGGATELWGNSGKPRMAVSVIEKFFRPEVLTGKVVNEIGKPIVGAKITLGSKSFTSEKSGDFSLVYVSDDGILTV
ncbi:hypothetical protein KKB40_00575 [Patescibacteria group bacterium]|nr:hypothetical protein [Patescibacteria group bacterium]